MDDMDVMAAMGIGGFGKQAKSKKLDPKRFDKQKRAVRAVCFANRLWRLTPLRY